MKLTSWLRRSRPPQPQPAPQAHTCGDCIDVHAENIQQLKRIQELEAEVAALRDAGLVIHSAPFAYEPGRPPMFPAGALTTIARQQAALRRREEQLARAEQRPTQEVTW